MVSVLRGPRRPPPVVKVTPAPDRAPPRPTARGSVAPRSAFVRAATSRVLNPPTTVSDQISSPERPPTQRKSASGRVAPPFAPSLARTPTTRRPSPPPLPFPLADSPSPSWPSPVRLVTRTPPPPDPLPPDPPPASLSFSPLPCDALRRVVRRSLPPPTRVMVRDPPASAPHTPPRPLPRGHATPVRWSGDLRALSDAAFAPHVTGPDSFAICRPGPPFGRVGRSPSSSPPPQPRTPPSPGPPRCPLVRRYPSFAPRKRSR